MQTVPKAMSGDLPCQSHPGGVVELGLQACGVLCKHRNSIACKHPQPQTTARGLVCTHRTHHFLIHGFGDRMPRLVVFNVAVVGVVCAVADAPTVIGHQDGRVCDVANQVVERFVVGKALMAAVRGLANICGLTKTCRQQQRPNTPYQSCPTTKSAQNMVP